MAMLSECCYNYCCRASTESSTTRKKSPVGQQLADPLMTRGRSPTSASMHRRDAALGQAARRALSTAHSVTPTSEASGGVASSKSSVSGIEQGLSRLQLVNELPPKEFPLEIHQLIAEYAYEDNDDDSDNYCLKVILEYNFEKPVPSYMRNLASAAAKRFTSATLDFQISHQGLTFLAECAASHLCRLHLRIANLTDDIFLQLAKFTQLEMLRLDDCAQISLQGLAPLASCSKLKYIIFNEAPLMAQDAGQLNIQMASLMGQISTLVSITCNGIAGFRQNLVQLIWRLESSQPSPGTYLIDTTSLTRCRVQDNRVVWPEGSQHASQNTTGPKTLIAT